MGCKTLMEVSVDISAPFKYFLLNIIVSDQREQFGHTCFKFHINVLSTMQRGQMTTYTIFPIITGASKKINWKELRNCPLLLQTHKCSYYLPQSRSKTEQRAFIQLLYDLSRFFYYCQRAIILQYYYTYTLLIVRSACANPP